MSDPKTSSESVFSAALAIASPEERAKYLDQACGADQQLRIQVEELLAAYPKVERFLESPAAGQAATVDQPTPLECPGTVIGPYKLLQQIGEGGMGVVYMAEQEEPVRRKVALKIIKPGMDSAQVIARFDAERHALALMDHQNIARVLDAGTTAGGRPYFVMELVKGVPITKFCDEQHLTPRERLELFVPVCQAIQHAHQKGIIHRDIKPSNILVTLYDGKPVPKVIDFGVAKAIEQRLTEQTMFTQFGQVVGTLEYMSPEQAELSALDIDTRSDIYSLGVLLYELLTGSTPLERKKLREAAFTEMLRMIRELEPPKPSTRLGESEERLPSISAQRKTEPARLTKLVRGELDWIVMKALEKDRSRRYETASGFARDIQRYLADEQVEACPPSASYKLRKFAHKNRKALATMGAFVLLLIGASAVSTWQAVRATKAEIKAKEAGALAQKRFDMAKEAVDRYLNHVTETPELKNSNLQELRKKLLQSAIPFYEKLAEEVPGDQEQEASRGNAYYSLGNIHLGMDEHTDAIADYEQARDIYACLADAYPSFPQYRYGLACILCNRAICLSKTGRTADGETAMRTALAIHRKAADDSPSEPTSNVRYNLTQNHIGLAHLLREQGKYAEAETEFRAVIKECRPSDHAALARSHDGLGHVLRRLGRHGEAETEHRAALNEQQHIADEHPGNLECRSELALGHYNLSLALADLGKDAEAEAEALAALKGQERLADEFPSVPACRQNLALNHTWLGAVLYRRGKHVEAETEHRAALKDLQCLIDKQPNLPEYRHLLALSHGHLGDALSSMAKWPEAETEYREALKGFEALVAEHPTAPDYRDALTCTHNSLVILLKGRGRLADAEIECRAGLKNSERLVEEHPTAPHKKRLVESHNILGVLLRALGRQVEAETEYRAALNELRSLVEQHPNVPDYQNDLAGVLVNLAQFRLDAKNPAEAKVLLEQALPHHQLARKADPRRTQFKQYYENNLATLWKVAKALMDLDDEERALVAYRTAAAMYQGLANEFPDNHEYRTTLTRLYLDLFERTKDAAGCRQTAETWEKLNGADAGSLYDAACIRAVTAAVARARDKSPKGAKQADAEAEQAMTWLKKAVAAGWTNAAHIAKDRDLNSLRERDDFKNLIAELEADIQLKRAAFADIKQGLWAEALECYDRPVKLDHHPPQRELCIPEDWFHRAILRLRTGDVAGYRLACRAMHRIAENTDNPGHAWPCSLDTRADIEPAQLVKWAEKGLAANLSEWPRHVLALAFYRAGRFEDAISRANESNNAANWQGRNMNWPLLAMAHHRLNHAKEARDWLDKANQEWRRLSPIAKSIETPTALPFSNPPWWRDERFWHDWTVFEILLAEANDLIVGNRGEADLLDLLHRAYLHAKKGEVKKAELEFQAAVAGRATEATAWLSRGRVFLLLAQKDRARADLVKAMELKPKDPEIRKELERAK